MIAGGQLIISTHSSEMLSSRSIPGGFLLLKPGTAGEATEILEPNRDDMDAMKNGMSPADVLLPQTSVSVGEL